MLLNPKTLEQLRIIINGDGTDDYRSGSALVTFFNELGFSEDYWKKSREESFPSRWIYTDEKLKKINGTPELDKAIKNVFAVQNFIGRISILDNLISNFNQYLAFDKWSVIRNNDIITFKKIDTIIIENDDKQNIEINKEDFLKQNFTIDINALGLDYMMETIIKERLKEIEVCINNGASLAGVFLIGSVMEGLLLSMATKYPKRYNQATAAPKNSEVKVRKIPEWALNNFIDVSTEIGVLKQDVKKFSHVVRDFRNYIHPYSQMSSCFSPDKDTALICFQVLKATLNQMEKYLNSNC